MSTLCTQPTSSSSANNNHLSNYSVGPAQAHRTGTVAKESLVKFAQTIAQFFVTRHNQRIDRQAFKNVLTLDDRMLKDIGVSRQDVKWASDLPLSEDAAVRLENIARRR